MNRQKQTENITPAVAIAEMRNYDKNAEKFAGRHLPLVTALGERGITAIALNGANDRSDEGQIFNRYFTLDTDTIREHTQPIRVDAAYDLTGGIGRYTPDVAALNPAAVRHIVRSKERQYDIFRDALPDNIARTEVTVATHDAVNEAINRMEAQKIMVKVNEDFGKQYPLLSGSKRDVAGHLDEFLDAIPPTEKVLVQEYMAEAEAAFHTDLRFLNATEKDIATAQHDHKRELRAHVMDESVVALHGRVGLNREGGSQADEWVYFHPESIPPQAIKLAQTAAQLIRTTTGAEDSYLAVDMTPDASRIVEVNGRNIGTIRPNPERHGAQDAHEVTTNMLADKLTAMAKQKVGAYE